MNDQADHAGQDNGEQDFDADEPVLNARQAVLECSDLFRCLACFFIRRASVFECFISFGKHHVHANKVLIMSHPCKRLLQKVIPVDVQSFLALFHQGTFANLSFPHSPFVIPHPFCHSLTPLVIPAQAGMWIHTSGMTEGRFGYDRA